MARKRSAWSRINAWLDFEVPAQSLEAYRRTSVLVDELNRQVQDRRLACVLDGVDPWSMPPGTRAGFLCAWNATVLQALGDALLDADAWDTPRTAGFVPRPLRDEVATYYAGVEAWLDRARQAFANPEYRLDCPVPDRLPVPAADPFPVLGMRDSRARGLLAALRAVREQAMAAMTLLPKTVADPARQAQVRAIRQQYDAALAAAREAERLHAAAPAREVERALEAMRSTLERFYALGQLVAAPVLAEPETTPPPPAEPAPPPPAPPPAKRAEPAPRPNAAAGATGPAPGQADPDMWCLTDPAARRSGEADVDTLGRMWRADQERAVALHYWIHAELALGHIDFAMDGGQRVPHWFRCPWGPVYVARRTVHLDGLPIPVDQRFVLDADSGNAGRPVRVSCRLVAGDAPRMEHPGKASSRPRGAEQAPRPGGSPGRLPGEPGFDVWCLTDPAAHTYGQASVDTLCRMWESDRERALALHKWIRAELALGHIDFATAGWQRVPHWFRCPWGPVYVARRTVYLDGLPIPVNQRFVLDADPGNDGRPVRLSCRMVAGDAPRMERSPRPETPSASRRAAGPTPRTAPPPAPRPANAPRPDGSRGRLPGEPGFDVWCLTHPAARKLRKATASALKCMWDAAPRRVLELHDQIQAALERGDIAPATDARGGALYGSHRPWGPIYVARRTVHLDGLRIPVNQRFVLETRSHDFVISCRLVARDPNDAPAPGPRARRHR